MSRIKQLLLEDLFDKNRLVPKITNYFKSNYKEAIQELSELHDIPSKFIVDVLVQIYLHKRAIPSVLVGSLVVKYLDDRERITEWLAVLVEANVLSYEAGRFVVLYGLPEALEEELERYQFPMPMLVEPRKVTKNHHSAYLSPLKRDSLLLNNAHHEEDIALDHINRVNAVTLTINLETAKGVKNKWANLDLPKVGETEDEYLSRVKSFERFNKHTEWVHELLAQNGNKFWLTHKYDKRGRTYNVGYYINYQGHDFNKAVVEFYDKEIVPLEGE